MKTEMKRHILGIVLLIFGFIAIIVLGGGVYMLSYALTPANNGGRDYDRQYRKLFKNYPETRSWTDSLRATQSLRDTFITGQDGDRHHALFVYAPKKTTRTALLVHGYTDCAVAMLHIGRIYHQELGYNLLIPDLHAHGKSEGKAIQMGWYDRLDVLHWAEIAGRLFGKPGEGAQIVVHGISMGAATAMCMTAEKLPGTIKCIVEDCGYTSVNEEFAHQLSEQFGLPAFPLIPVTSMLCKMKYDWWFGDCEPIDRMRNCRLPVLFIHGSKDNYVPTYMAYDLFRSKPEPKQLVIFKNAAHLTAYKSAPKKYAQQVERFVRQYIR